jgi:hypothetical protein
MSRIRATFGAKPEFRLVADVDQGREIAIAIAR